MLACDGGKKTRKFSHRLSFVLKTLPLPLFPCAVCNDVCGMVD